jgi:hypothetical protein
VYQLNATVQIGDGPAQRRFPVGVKPSERQGSSKKKGYHNGGVWCVLFAKHSDAQAAREVGEAKRQEGAFEDLRNHAEQRWWDHATNPTAIAKEVRSKTIERLEFEVSIDFCKKPGEGARRTCRDRFPEARMLAGDKVPIYIFIQAPRIYYEVTPGGLVVLQGSW